MSWTVPLSSSPPSTPGSNHRTNNANGFGTYAANPSTTPAGPPPSSTNSFTPAGPPPSNVFPTSGTDFSHPPLNQKPNLFTKMGSQRDPNSPSFKTVHPNKQARELQSDLPLPRFQPWKLSETPGNQPFRSSPPFGPGSDDDQSPESESYGEQEEEDLEEGDYSEESEQGSVVLDSHTQNQLRGPASMKYSSTNDSVMSGGNLEYTHYGSSVNDVTPRGTKRSLVGVLVYHMGHLIAKRSPTGRRRTRQYQPWPKIWHYNWALQASMIQTL